MTRKRVDPKWKHLLGVIFDGAREGLRAELSTEEYERRRYDFVFHFEDCLDDFEEFVHLANQSKPRDEDEASVFLIGFLYHVVPHLNAAGRLLLDEIRDPFTEPEQRQ